MIIPSRASPVDKASEQQCHLPWLPWSSLQIAPHTAVRVQGVLALVVDVELDLFTKKLIHVGASLFGQLMAQS